MAPPPSPTSPRSPRAVRSKASPLCSASKIGQWLLGFLVLWMALKLSIHHDISFKLPALQSRRAARGGHFPESAARYEEDQTFPAFTGHGVVSSDQGPDETQRINKGDSKQDRRRRQREGQSVPHSQSSKPSRPFAALMKEAQARPQHPHVAAAAASNDGRSKDRADLRPGSSTTPRPKAMTEEAVHNAIMAEEYPKEPGKDSKERDRQGRKMGTQKRVLVVEDGECKYRPPEVIRRCNTLATAYSSACGGWGFDSHYHHGYIAAFRLVQPFMAAAQVPNYKAVRYDDEKVMKKAVKQAEIIITVAMLMPKLLQIAPESAKFVVVERADAAPIVEDNFYNIKSQRVAAVLKHTSLHPVSRNNDDLLMHGRHHYIQLDPKLAPQGQRRTPPLPQWALKKVHAMVPQVFRFSNPLECGGKRHYLHLRPALTGAQQAPAAGNSPTPALDDAAAAMEDTEGQKGRLMTPPLPPVPVTPTALVQPKPLSQRSIDVAFLGGTQNHEVLKKHRARAADAIQAMGSRHKDLKVVSGLQKTKTVAEFYELLGDVKFFVSPYGYGEFANKDYEAILSGCVLVKPLAHQLSAFPNIYKPGVTAVDVKGDFSDLERMVLPLLESLPQAQEIANQALNQLRKFSDPSLVAEHISVLLHRIA